MSRKVIFQFFFSFFLPLSDFLYCYGQAKRNTAGNIPTDGSKHLCGRQFSRNQYEVYVCNPIEHLLLVKVKSRHYSIVRHTVFIHCTWDGEIQGLYCTCKLMFVSVDVVPMWPLFFSVSKELMLASFQKQTVKWTVGGIIILRSRCQICSCYIVSYAVFYSSLIQHSQILKTYTPSSWYILSSLMHHS